MRHLFPVSEAPVGIHVKMVLTATTGAREPGPWSTHVRMCVLLCHIHHAPTGISLDLRADTVTWNYLEGLG